MNRAPANSLINGVAADYLNISDRAIHYGDGLFETILCSDNKLYFWRQHFQRMQASAEKLNISCPDESVFLHDINQLFDSSRADNGSVVKIILSRGSGERGYTFSKDISANRAVLLSALATEHSSLLSGTLLSGELFICTQQASINESLAGLKHLNRLENVMARNEIDDRAARYIDGLMLNADNHVIEGTMSNLFAVKAARLFTPDLARSGVRGVMRDMIIGLAEKNDLQVTVSDLEIEELKAMDELFITNSLIGMKRVTKLGDTVYQQQAVTEQLFDELLKTREDYVQAV